MLIALLAHHLQGLLLLAPPPPPQPPADSTGIGQAMINLADLGIGAFGGVLTFFLVVEGFRYMFADEGSRGIHAKKALSILIGGSIFVLLAATLAPLIVKAVLGG